MTENDRRNDKKDQQEHSTKQAHQAGPGDIIWALWAVWVVIIFVVTLLLFYPAFLIFSHFRKDPQRARGFISLSRIWMGVFLPLAGCPLRIKGREYFKKGQTYIVVCNHNALMDVPVVTPGIPGGNKTIAKIEMAKIPLFGLMYKAGSILVDRKEESSRRDSFAKMKDTLEMGLHMCLYPEGTRNKTNQPLKEFHNGAFRLSLSTGKAIIPSLIFNTRKVMPPDKKFYFRPYRLRLHFLPPVLPTKEDTADTLKQKVFNIMWEYYIQNVR